MECKNTQELLIDFIENNLSAEQYSKVAQHIEQCASCKKELDDTQQFLNDLAKDRTTYPSERLRNNFEEMLSFEHQKIQNTKIVQLSPRKQWMPVVRVAASILLILSGFLFGRYQQNKQYNESLAILQKENIASKETAMLALMENESASKRIKGVQYIEEFSEPDPKIVDALIKRMLSDDNTNVRLTAANALQAFITSETVKDAFIEALETEKDPAIQITIIKSLVKIQEKKAFSPMKKLLEKEETQSFIKDEIKTVLPNII